MRLAACGINELRQQRGEEYQSARVGDWRIIPLRKTRGPETGGESGFATESTLDFPRNAVIPK